MDHLKFNSIFLPDVEIGVVFSENENYNTLKPIFEEMGYGFMVPNENMIVIDGEILLEFGKDLLRFIEAHEVSHILLGHDGPRNAQDEIDADLGAYLLLSQINEQSAINFLVDFCEERHGQEFDKNRLEIIEKHFSDYL